MDSATENLNQYGEFSLSALGLLDRPAPPSFNALTKLAMRMFHVPVALISIVQEERDRQFFLSHEGLAEPWRSAGQTPLSHSFCKHVKQAGEPLIVSDARKHSLVSQNRAITELDVIAYLGVPICTPDGTSIGAVCVIESMPRTWTEQDLRTLSDLADCINDEILLRAALVENERLMRQTRRYNAMREAVSVAFMTPDLSVEDRFEAALRAGCHGLGMQAARIVRLDGVRMETLFCHDDAGLFAPKHRDARFDGYTRLVADGGKNVCVTDIARHGQDLPATAQLQGSYAGSPLVFDAELYGVLEFCSHSPRAGKWSEEELSILTTISMFVTAHLGLFGQIERLKRSERALLQYLSDTRNAASAVFHSGTATREEPAQPPLTA